MIRIGERSIASHVYAADDAGSLNMRRLMSELLPPSSGKDQGQAWILFERLYVSQGAPNRAVRDPG